MAEYKVEKKEGYTTYSMELAGRTLSVDIE